ncbi:YggS family pyridoxal phosphate-dependent enzyme [Alteromonas gracilis]
MTAAREQELAAGLGRVRARIAEACSSAGRAPDEVTLVVVTKFFPASDVRLLRSLGVSDVGENRHQEAEAKAAEVDDASLRWHFIGNLQSNKAADVARYAHAVHSVDRAKLLRGLSRGSEARVEQAGAQPLEVLVQVDLDPEPQAGRGGVRPEGLMELADRVADTEHLSFRGLMAVAPLGEEPAAAFERLAALRADLLAQHPSADRLSAGMSGDLEEAVAIGATHVRVGSAILGGRPSIP